MNACSCDTCMCGFMCMDVHVEVRSWHWVSSSSTLRFVTEAGSFTEPKDHGLASLTSQLTLRCHRLASLTSQLTPRSHLQDYKMSSTPPRFHVMLKDPNSDLHSGRAKAFPTEPSVWPLSALTFYFPLGGLDCF